MHLYSSLVFQSLKIALQINTHICTLVIEGDTPGACSSGSYLRHNHTCLHTAGAPTGNNFSVQYLAQDTLTFGQEEARIKLLIFQLVEDSIATKFPR